MRTLILVLVLLLTSIALQAVMTSTEYTARYALKLKELHPEMQISVAGDLSLVIKVGQSYEARHWLDNSFAEYRSTPDSFAEIVARYGKAALPREDIAIDASQIIPVVKDTGWIHETNAALKASSGCEMTDYVKEEICEGLVILYAQDKGDTLTYLHADDLKSLNLSIEALHLMALKNLQRILKKIERHDSDGVYFYTAGGTYEASLILCPWMWDTDNFELPGDVVFAVPTRDVLIATSSHNPIGIDRIRRAVERIYADKPNYRLTGDLFSIVGGHIKPFKVEPNKSVEVTLTAVTPGASAAGVTAVGVPHH